MDTAAESLAKLIEEQQSDALDDGFPYEHVGAQTGLSWDSVGWITPTAFMVVELKELLTILVGVYGYQGHWLMREIGRDNLRDMQFIEGLGLSMFLKLRAAAWLAMPDDKRAELVE